MTTIDRCFGCGATQVASSESLPVERYQVLRCSRCGTTSTAPLPTVDELATFYASYSDNYAAGMSSDRYDREMPKRWAARLRMIRRCGGRGRLADIGGANGMFARLAHEQGFAVSVADYVPETIDLGFAKVVPANLSVPGGVPFADGSFDVVTLWSCLEHVLDPDAALHEAKRVARSGAIIAADTPLVGDLCERVFPARSHWLAPPEHLNVFSARGLRGAFERAGLEVLVHEPFHERTRLRWVARRARNVAVALRGASLRLRSREAWREARATRTTLAGDIQVLLARVP